MSVNIQKGSSVSLTKAANQAGLLILENVIVGLGWDASTNHGEQFDLDASAILLGQNNKASSAKDLIFYNNLKGIGIQHMGDNLTGAGEGDDESIAINLREIEQKVTRIMIAVTIYDAQARNQTFGRVSNAYIRIYDRNTGTEIVKYNLSNDFNTETGVIMGELDRVNDSWDFKAIGAGFDGGIGALAKNAGINV